MVFDMADHPDGLYTSYGAYGLRLDTFGNPSPPSGEVGSLLFSVEIGGADVDLTFDPNNLPGGAVLEGSITTTYASGEAFDPGPFSMHYELTGLAVAPNGGFLASGGEGYIDAGYGFFHFSGKSDGESVFYFDADDHRLSGYGYDPDSWVARGWLENFAFCDGSDRSTATCEAIETVGTNDFLLTAPNGGDIPGVPEPSTMLLTMGGVALLWLRKRRS